MRARWLLVVLVLVAGACSDPGSGADAARSITVQVSGEPEETKVYRAVATAFEDSNEGVEVELVEVPDKDEHLAKLTTAFAGGEPPEVFLVNFREYSQFVVRGAVTPYAGYLEENDVDLSDYFEQPIEAFTYDGALQCMPQNISSLVVYYNEDLFARAGLSRPRAGWNWEDFRRTALALTEGNSHGLGIEPNIIRIAPFVWSNGGDIVDDLDAPTRFTLDDPAAREALEFVVSLVREDGVVPSEQEVAAQDLETRFVTGKLGMFLSSRRDTPVLREVRGLRWDVAPLPVGEEPAGILHSDAYCLAAGAPEETTSLAARFIAFATGEQGQTITALGGRTVPSLQKVARSGAFLDPTQPPAHPEVFLDGIDHIRRTPVLATWPEIEDITEEILTRAFYEFGYTIDQAISDLATQTEPLFQEGAEL
jgi:multiple sugar transport system substrate-binding protein